MSRIFRHSLVQCIHSRDRRVIPFLFALAVLSFGALWISHSGTTKPGLLPPTLSVSRRGANNRYSTHNCVGYSWTGDGLRVTRCRFRNVCLKLLDPIRVPKTHPIAPGKSFPSSVDLSYFSASVRSPPVYWSQRFGLLQRWACIDRDSSITPTIVYDAIPDDARWSPAKTTVLTEAFWPENFGHALGDDFLPVYRLAKSFGLWDRKDVGVIFHPSCHQRGDPVRGCAHHAEMAPLLLDRPIENVSSPIWPTDGSPLCFENLLVGTRLLGMGLPSENSWSDFVAEIKTQVGLNPQYQPRKQKITIFLKHGRRVITNYDELMNYLATRFEVEVEVVDPAALSLAGQIDRFQDTTVVISPCGGVSFSSVFLSKGTSTILVDYWNADYNGTGQMERHIYTWQSDITPLYYPLELGDLSLNNPKIPPSVLADSNKVNLMRDWADVTISMERMEVYVQAALTSSEIALGLHDSFKWDPSTLKRK